MPLQLRNFALGALVVMLLSPSALAVVGGRDADPGEYPWIAALVSPASSDDWSGQFCAGSLVAPTFVVTAAHCLSLTGQGLGRLGIAAASDVNDLLVDRPFVVIGKTELTETGGERIPMKQAWIHPRYNMHAKSDHDIAIIELLSPSSAPTLPWATTANAALYAPGLESTIIGWGYDGSEYPDHLQEAEVPIVSDDACQSAYSGAIHKPTQICAGYMGVGGIDTCGGDSGGPLLVRDGEGWLLAGVTSWGFGCAEPEYPGVYSEVAAFSAFLDEHVS